MEVVAQPAMPGIEQAVEVSSAPSNVRHQFRVEAAQNLSDRADAHPIDPATLEQRDLPDSVRSGRRDPLAPAQPVPQVTTDPFRASVLP